MLVAVKFGDAHWVYRAIVVENFEMRWKVLLIDAGIHIYVPHEVIYPLLPQFAEIGPLAITCRIPELVDGCSMMTKSGGALAGQRIEKVQYELKSFFADAKRNGRKLEAVILQVEPLRNLPPNFQSCVVLDVVFYLDGADLFTELETLQFDEYRPVRRIVAPTETEGKDPEPSADEPLNGTSPPVFFKPPGNPVKNSENPIHPVKGNTGGPVEEEPEHPPAMLFNGPDSDQYHFDLMEEFSY